MGREEGTIFDMKLLFVTLTLCSLTGGNR